MSVGRKVTGEVHVWGARSPGVVVNQIGAVSPTPIAIERNTPVRICGKAIGSATRVMYCAGPAPDPSAASRIGRGTELKARSAVRKMYGVMKNARVRTPAPNDRPQPKYRT